MQSRLLQATGRAVLYRLPPLAKARSRQ